MNVKTKFLVVRTPDGVYDAQGLTEDGMYDEVMVEYSPDYVTKEDLLEWGRKTYGDNLYSAIGGYLDKLEQGLCFSLQYEARHLPSLGKMKVAIEEFDVEVI